MLYFSEYCNSFGISHLKNIFYLVFIKFLKKRISSCKSFRSINLDLLLKEKMEDKVYSFLPCGLARGKNVPCHYRHIEEQGNSS